MEFMREQRTSDARNPVLIDSGQLAEAEERLKSLVRLKTHRLGRWYS
jgi:hypothetical protein